MIVSLPDYRYGNELARHDQLKISSFMCVCFNDTVGNRVIC